MGVLTAILSVISALEAGAHIYNSYVRNKAMQDLTSLKSKVSNKNISDSQAISELNRVINEASISMSSLSPGVRSILKEGNKKRQNRVDKLEKTISNRNDVVDQATDIANNAAYAQGIGGAAVNIANAIGGKDAISQISKLEKSIK